MAYAVESNTDANGLTYETVADDPTGLRLYTLDNGLKVYLSKNIDEPKIQTYIAVRAGSNYDPKESTGLAHYLEHMVFKGTDEIGGSCVQLSTSNTTILLDYGTPLNPDSKPVTLNQNIDAVSMF